MPTLLSDFDYTLPPERIAHESLASRESAKLLVVNRTAEYLTDLHIRDLPDLLQPGDLLVFNNSKVFKARLEGQLTDGSSAECFLLHPLSEYEWEALIQPGKKLQPQSTITLGDVTCTLIEKTPQGTARVRFPLMTEEVFTLCEERGTVPIPPYVEKTERNEKEYQTIYAKERGSVAAPTAGFHFTESLLQQLKEKGVRIAYVTLHVGLGTFRPIKTETLEEHTMHSEWAHVPTETTKLIRETQAQGHRIIAVGTTSTRALESWGLEGDTWSGFTDLFISPGYTFRVIDGLITNFHLPKSSLLVLVSALAGRERILKAYQHAINHDYRFYSFGDAMFIS